MKVETLLSKGYKLMHEGIMELARVEGNGIRIDQSLLSTRRTEMAAEIRKLTAECESDTIWYQWKRRFGQRSNLTSRTQFAEIFYGELHYKVPAYTDKGQPSTDEEALQKIDHPFARKYARLLKYDKALGTFIHGIAHEVCNGRLHPVFNLHIAQSYRSSSDSPNFQNFPVRDKEIAELIRTLFIPSEGCVLVENDFKGIEVALSASFHLDPVFIDYITTPGKDMHRDMAAQIYMLKPEEVSKDARYGAKNKFVFPQFYGDWYKSCAPQLWEWIEKGKLKGPDGNSLFEHLKARGVKTLGDLSMEEGVSPKPGTFEEHLQKVEKDFWENRFMVYGQWRKDFYKKYLDKGFFDIPTGFRIHGSFNRKQCTNFPIQGAAFHCLLWSLIQVNRQLRKYKMKSKVVGQIHDSMLGDIRQEELVNYLEIVHNVVSNGLPKQYPWLAVKPEIETEISPSSWFHKREVKFKDGKLQHPTKPKLFTKDPMLFMKALQNN